MKPRLYIVTVFSPHSQPQCKPYLLYAYTRREAIEHVQDWLGKSTPNESKVMDARPPQPGESVLTLAWWPIT